MVARWRAALAAAVLAAPAGAQPPAAAGGRACELERADRRRATARDCMTCHDGSAGPGVGFQMSATGNGMSHPVEVDYASVAARSPTHYRGPATLPPELPLVAGKIQCTTCHDGASRDPKRVVAVKDLCRACHDL